MWEGTAPRGSQGDPGLDPRPSELPGSYTETEPSSGSQLQTQLSGFAAGSHAVLLRSRMPRIHLQDCEPGPTACDPCDVE